MSATAIAGFMSSDYGVVAAVKMLNFFRFLGGTGLIVLGILVLASIFVQNFWCRYLCPYGALLGFASLVSPLRIRREPEPCIDCAKCGKVCPSNLPVDELVTIKSAECTGCLECVAVCPVEGALHLALPRILKPPRRVTYWAMAAGVAVLFFGSLASQKLPAGGIRTFPRRFTANWCPTPTRLVISCPGTQKSPDKRKYSRTWMD